VCAFSLPFLLGTYDRLLFFLVAVPALFQSEYHIAGTLEEASIPFPAYAAFTMLQADKLLFHFSAAVGAYFIVFSHSVFSR
jgi:hypothetical protein